MKLYKCDKSIIRFYPQGATFLKGYTTNVMEAPKNAFVDLQGKILVVFDQFKKSEEEVWVVLETKFVERLMAHLEKYLFLTETKAERLNQNVYQDLESKELILSDEKLSADATEEEFTLFRVKNRLPLQGVDFDEEMILNLPAGQAGVGNEEFVSYTKGCYLGQEIVARVHYRSKPPKKLVVKKESDCGPEERKRMTSRVTDPATGQGMGFVFTENKA